MFASTGWVRVVALLAVLAMVASVGYSALLTMQAPTWIVLVLAALVGAAAAPGPPDRHPRDPREALTAADQAWAKRIALKRSDLPDALDALEQAVRDHRRIALRRRGNEYVVVAERLDTGAMDERLEGRLPMTGEVLSFRLRELETFTVLP
jgi:hypothetical protein